MRTIEGIQVIEAINDFLRDGELQRGFYTWQGEKDSDFINEPDRASRCHDAAADGCDGKLHCEVIDDFREFGSDLLEESERSALRTLDDLDVNEDEYVPLADAIIAAVDECRALFAADVDRLEKWHIENGSYEQQCG